MTVKPIIKPADVHAYELGLRYQQASELINLADGMLNFGSPGQIQLSVQHALFAVDQLQQACDQVLSGGSGDSSRLQAVRKLLADCRSSLAKISDPSAAGAYGRYIIDNNLSDALEIIAQRIKVNDFKPDPPRDVRWFRLGKQMASGDWKLRPSQITNPGQAQSPANRPELVADDLKPTNQRAQKRAAREKSLSQEPEVLFDDEVFEEPMIRDSTNSDWRWLEEEELQENLRALGIDRSVLCPRKVLGRELVASLPYDPKQQEIYFQLELGLQTLREVLPKTAGRPDTSKDASKKNRRRAIPRDLRCQEFIRRVQKKKACEEIAAIAREFAKGDEKEAQRLLKAWNRYK